MMNRRHFLEYLFDTGIAAAAGMLYTTKLLVPVAKPTPKERFLTLTGDVIEARWTALGEMTEIDRPYFIPDEKLLPSDTMERMVQFEYVRDDLRRGFHFAGTRLGIALKRQTLGM